MSVKFGNIFQFSHRFRRVPLAKHLLLFKPNIKTLYDKHDVSNYCNGWICSVHFESRIVPVFAGITAEISSSLY